MESTQEIRKEKVLVPGDMNIKDIMNKYVVAETTTRNSRRKGWLIKNYIRNRVIIDRENFNPAISYSIAKQVFWKRFRHNPVALNIREDMLQVAVSIMFMQSGKVKEGANEKYNEHYGYWWCAFNAMSTYLNKRIRQTQDNVELDDNINR